MRTTARELLLLIVVSVLFFSERGQSFNRRVYKRRVYNIANRQVYVRIYENPAEDHYTYRLVQVPLKGTLIDLSGYGVDESMIVMMVGEDQRDEEVRGFLRSGSSNHRLGYQSWPIAAFVYRDGQPLNLKERKSTCSYTVYFKDALYRAADGVKVKFYIYSLEGGCERRVFIREVELDQSGQFEVPYFRGNVNCVYLEVTHSENYGEVVVNIGWNNNPPGGNSEKVILPWVSAARKDYLRTVCGVVVDDANEPVAGAKIRCYGNPKGSPTCLGVITDANGWFTFFPRPPCDCDEDTHGGEPLLKIRVDAPRESALVPFIGAIKPDPNCNVIKLNEYGRFHTFVFQENGVPITEPEKLEELEVWIEREGRPTIRYTYYGLAGGRYVPNGIYRADYIQGYKKKYEFEPVDVNDDSPEELVFEIKKSLKYVGTVVDAVTGEPMPDVILITAAKEFSDSSNAGRLTDEQWEQLISGEEYNRAKKTVFHQLFGIFSCDQIAITDEQGRFTIHSDFGHTIPMVRAFKKNYLDIRQSTASLKPDSNGVVTVPDIPMFRAAKVILRPVISSDMMVYARWLPEPNDLPLWAANPSQVAGYRSFFKLYFGDSEEPVDKEYKPSKAEVVEAVPYGGYAPVGLQYPSWTNPGFTFFATAIGYLLEEMMDRFSLNTDFYYPAYPTGLEDLTSEEWIETGSSQASETLQDYSAGVAAGDVIPAEQQSGAGDDRTLVGLLMEGGHFYEDEIGFIHKRIILNRNKPNAFYVPAGVKIRLEVATLYRDYAPIIAAKNLLLKQGQTFDIGDIVFEKKIKVYARVVDSSGKPVVGVPVGMWYKFGGKTKDLWYNGLITDKTGRLAFMVPPRSKGKFYVRTYYLGQELQKVAPFEVNGPQDVNSVFTLQVPDKMLEALLKEKEELK